MQQTSLLPVIISFMAVIVSSLSLVMAYVSLKDRRELSRLTIIQNRLLDILPQVVDSEYKADSITLLKSEQIIRALLKTIPFDFIPKNTYIRQRFSLGFPVATLVTEYKVGDDPRWEILKACMNPNHNHPKKGAKKEVDNLENYLALMPRCLVLDIDGNYSPLQDVMLGELRAAFNNGLSGNNTRIRITLKAVGAKFKRKSSFAPT